jgi:hypothetical protein
VYSISADELIVKEARASVEKTGVLVPMDSERHTHMTVDVGVKNSDAV